MNDGAMPRAQAQVRKCNRWSGPPEWYQAEARTRLGVTVHLLVLPTCSTPMCLQPEHLDSHKPRALDYPDGICVYCGLLADTVDHLLPRTWTGEGARRGVLTVPACRQCNSIIGDSYAPAINERREIVHEALHRKYHHELAVADDIDDVMAELGPNLRSAVAAQIKYGDLLRDRLAWPGTTGYDVGACIRSGIDDPYAAGLLTHAEPVVYSGADPSPARAPAVITTDQSSVEGDARRRALDSGATPPVAGHVGPLAQRPRRARLVPEAAYAADQECAMTDPRTMSDAEFLAALTPGHIETAITDALGNHDVEAVPGLLRVLAVKDPHRAQAVLDTIELATALRDDDRERTSELSGGAL